MIAVSAALAFNFLNLDLPKLDRLQDYKPNLASQIISKDGVILAELGLEKREIASMKEIPPRVLNAFLSAEDDNFYTHKGVDYLGLARAMFANLKAGRVVQGGSTITQQVAKTFLLSSEKSITRKIKDFILAQRIEEKLTKEEILYLYLNQVYLGGGFYGVKAAAHGYFNKELKEMTIAESAMIAGLLVAPGKYSPYVNPHAAKKRQNYVIERMLKNKKITQAEFDQAMNEKTVYRINDDRLKAGYFTEWVRQKIVEQVGEENFLKNGFRVITSLDWELQKNAEIQLIKSIKEIDKRQGYKGPVARIGLDELPNFEVETRKKIMRERSQFFVIENGEKRYEHHFNADLFNKIREDQDRLKAGNNSDDFLVPGIDIKDTLPDVIDSNKMYEAVVKKVDDIARIVYVTVGGTPGIIPHENFKWAHKRSINENTAYYKEIEKPSDILRVGDIIHVEMLKKNVQIAGFLSKDGTAFLSKSRNANIVKLQKYLLLQLDQAPEAQGALYSLDAKTGEVLSYVGGIDYQKSKFNRVIQAKRQPGSSFKPLLFAAAVEKGYQANSIIMDTPEAMPGFDSASSWKPKNYDGEFLGPVTFRQSLEQSRNIPTIKIADKVGVSNILNFADRIGFNAKLENNLSIALGTFGVSLRDLVSTYSIFPNGGKFIMPKAIISVEDRDRKKYTIDEFEKDMKKPSILASDPPTLLQSQYGATQVYDPRHAFIMTHILKGVITSGTGAAAREISANIGGKTGTTNDYVDAWFVGFNPRIVTGTWAGFDDNKTLGFGETGGRAVLPVWREYMRLALKKYGDDEFQMPPGVEMQWIDKKSGRKAAPNALGAILEAFLQEGDINTPGIASPDGTITPPKPANMGDDDYYENQ